MILPLQLGRVGLNYIFSKGRNFWYKPTPWIFRETVNSLGAVLESINRPHLW